MENTTLSTQAISETNYRFQYTSSVGLARNGWTKPMIDLLLNEPDKVVPNPHNVTGSLMRLYLVERVQKIENSPGFRRWVQLETTKKKHHKSIKRRQVPRFSRTRFGIERDDLSVYSSTELQRMSHFAHTAGELVGQANISSDQEPLGDLDEALNTALSAIERVLLRIEKRLARELAGRTPVETSTSKTAARLAIG